MLAYILDYATNPAHKYVQDILIANMYYASEIRLQVASERHSQSEHVQNQYKGLFEYNIDRIDTIICRNYHATTPERDKQLGINSIARLDHQSHTSRLNQHTSRLETLERQVRCDVFIYNLVALLTALDSISSSSGRSFVRLSSELAPIPSPSSNILCLASDCGRVHLKQFPIALVASPKTMHSLSSPYLCPVSKFLCSSNPGPYLYSPPSYTKSTSRYQPPLSLLER